MHDSISNISIAGLLYMTNVENRIWNSSPKSRCRNPGCVGLNGSRTDNSFDHELVPV
jgi:hypothetical protein